MNLTDKRLILAGLCIAISVVSIILLCLSHMWGSSLRVRAMQRHLQALQVRLAMSHARGTWGHANRQGFWFELLEPMCAK